jgi:L-xylulokinase
MKNGIFVGIDMGSTSLKAVAFDGGTGAVLAAAGGALPFIRLPRGGCELDAASIEVALMRALQEVASQLGPRAAQVSALCCTGHGAGLYALDGQGKLLRGRAVASTDQRAAGRARALAMRRGAELFEEVGCQPWAGQPSMIAAEVLGQAAIQRGDLATLLFAKDYLGLLLTGEQATDASDASTAGLLCLETGGWSRLALAAAGLPDLTSAALPAILPAGTVLGQLLPQRAAQCGLPAGLPVVLGAIDLLASLAAVAAPQRGQAVAVLGTWCVNAVVDGQREPKPAVGAVVNFGTPGQRLYLENSPSSMANIAWLARTLRFDSAAQVVDCAMTAPLGALGLRFLPFINGGGAPEGATAGFIGLQAHHDRSHMARAVVDAVAALHARHLARLASFGLGVRGPVAALGGGARDARLVRLIASFLGQPMERCGDDETGARGAALYAARSQGVTLPAPPVEVVEDDAGEAAAHADYYDSFHELVDTLAPAFAQMAEAQA